jgi:hypothetical protein
MQLADIDAAASDRIEAAISILDRRPQNEAAMKRVRAVLKQSQSRTLLVVLPGWTRDLPATFAWRLGRIDLQGLATVSNSDTMPVNDGPWLRVDMAPWPQGRGTDEIIMALAGQFGLEDTEEYDNCVRFLSERNANLFFSHRIGWDEWSGDQARLVRDWIGVMSGSWPCAVPGRFAIGVLCLDLGPRRSWSRPFWLYRIWAMARFVRALEREFATATRQSVLIAPRLGLILPGEVQEWAAAAGRYLKVDGLVSAIGDALPGMFPGMRHSIDFASAREKLMKPLMSYLHPTTRYYGPAT